MKRSGLNRTDAWFELDDNAKFYPLIMTERTQSAFRLTVELKDRVNSVLLERALNDILPRFPSFRVRMRRGLFWHYYVLNDLPARTEADDGLILKRIWENTNNHYLFRLSYSERNINLDVYHVLCDGMGALEIMKTLLHRYLQLSGVEMTDTTGILTYDQPPEYAEYENSFATHYQNTRFADVNVRSYAGNTYAYTVNGTKPMKAGVGLNRVSMPYSEIRELSRRYDCTLTVFLSAVLLNAIYNNQYRDKKLNKALLAFIPINMRPYYGSRTLRNFVTFSRAGIRKGDPTRDLNDFVRAVKRDLATDTTPEQVAAKMNAAVSLQRMAPIRFMPLALKEIIIRYGKSVFATTKHTICLSNLGKCDLPPALAPYVDNLFFVMNPSKKLPVSLSVNSFNGVVNITFSRCIIQTDTEREFVRLLHEVATKHDLPLNIEVSSNFW